MKEMGNLGQTGEETAGEGDPSMLCVSPHTSQPNPELTMPKAGPNPYSKGLENRIEI